MWCIICLSTPGVFNPRSFHILPNEYNISKGWTDYIQKNSTCQSTHTLKKVYVCSDHFTGDCFINVKKKRKLRQDAVPNISYNTQSETQNDLGTDGRTSAEEGKAEEMSHENDDTEKVEFFMHRRHVSGQIYVQQDHCDTSSLASPRPPRYIKAITASRVKANVTDLVYYTGFKHPKVFDAFFELFYPVVKKLPLITCTTEMRTPYPDTPSRKPGPQRIVFGEDQFLMVMMRLRQNTGEKLLGDIFGVSTSTVSRTINSWIIIMSDILQQFPIWQSKDMVKRNLPERFHKFPDLQLILDCTEIEIEKPSATLPQKETFSNYKQRNTVKGLCAISPNGVVTFVSALYGGSSKNTDAAITEHSKLLDLIEEPATIMADRGFRIQELCANRNIQVIIPDFLQGQAQLTPEQVKRSREIAVLRQLVEVIIGNIKQYKILHNKIPLTMAPIVNEIWLVCTHMANYTGQILNSTEEQIE